MAESAKDLGIMRNHVSKIRESRIRTLPLMALIALIFTDLPKAANIDV